MPHILHAADCITDNDTEASICRQLCGRSAKTDLVGLFRSQCHVVRGAAKGGAWANGSSLISLKAYDTDI